MIVRIFQADQQHKPPLLWPFAGLHCEHLPILIEVHDFEQFTVSEKDATGVPGIDPAPRCISILVEVVKVSIVFVLISMFIMVATV